MARPDVARQLGWQLGVKVSLDSVRYPRPGVVRCEGLALVNPETGRRVLFCQGIETRSTRRQSGPLLVITPLDPPQIEADQMDELGRLVERLVARRGGWPQLDVQLKVPEVTLVTESGRLGLAGVEGRLRTLAAAEVLDGTDPGASGTVAQLALSFPGTTSGGPAKVSLRRVRPGPRAKGQSPPVTELSLDTGAAPLPCPLLAAFWPEASRLGPRARFRGTIAATAGRGPWSAQVQGTLQDVDLQRLVADHIEPHRLTGTADSIELTRLRLSGGVAQEVEATIDARKGTISRGLVEAAARHLRLTSGLVPSDPAEIPFDRLTALVTLDARGLSLRALPESNQGAILSDRGGAILKADHSGPVHPIALAEILPNTRR